MQGYGHPYGEKPQAVPTKDGFSLGNQNIQQVDQKGQNDQTQKLPGKYRGINTNHRHDHQVVTEKSDEGQGREVALQVHGLEGVHHNGYGVDK